ncbi:MAG: hypothetical protein ACOY45_04305 [Pseudomonadota bacterium]
MKLDQVKFAIELDRAGKGTAQLFDIVGRVFGRIAFEGEFHQRAADDVDAYIWKRRGNALAYVEYQLIGAGAAQMAPQRREIGNFAQAKHQPVPPLRPHGFAPAPCRGGAVPRHLSGVAPG